MRRLFLSCLGIIFIVSCANAAPEQISFHPPQTEAETALNSIFERDRAQDLNMYEYILGRPSYQPENDPGYATLMTSRFIEATRAKERQVVEDTCNGIYKEGELCGIDIHLPVCGQDMTGLGFAYQTMNETQSEAYIRYVWLEHLNDAEPHAQPDVRMVKSGGRWLLDGLDCGSGYRFNM